MLQPKRIGLFFGSFNPVHVGHLIIAEYMATRTELDQVWFVVSPHNPLKNRATLVIAFILLDGRHTLQKIDREFMQWCAENGVPFSIIYTKADKVKKDELAQNIASIQKDLLEDWEELPDQFISSAETGLGQEDILKFIAHLREKV